MLVDLKGRHALVTGGGTGIGSALCIGLARCGATVVINYSRSKNDAEQTVKVIKTGGGQAIAVKADITDEDQVKQLVDISLNEFGGLHILVANAGGPTEYKPTIELEEGDWNQGMGINCKSVFYCVKHTVPHLPNKTGRVIINSSGSARSGAGPGMITYAASKGAIAQLTRQMAIEYAGNNIRVVAVCPGTVDTPLVHESAKTSGNYDQYMQKLYDGHPIGRIASADEIAKLYLYLSSDDASFITGANIMIDGGFTAQ